MILTIGTTPALARSMIFDRVMLDAVNRALEVRVAAAGKSVNVARVLKTIGHAPVCTGLLGGDPGRSMRAELDALGIAHAFVESRSPTRVCVTMIERATSHATELIEESGPTNEAEIDQLLRAVDQLAVDAAVVVCSGTIAPGAPETLYEQIAVRVKGRPTIVDAKAVVLRATLAHGVIVKCNRTELAECANLPVTDDAAFRRAIDWTITAGARAAVISDGAAATWVHDGKTLWTIPTPRVTVVSPIGSGDSMAAGVAAGIERGWPIIDCAKLGVACGAANAQTAIAGGVDAAEVERLFSALTACQLSS